MTAAAVPGGLLVGGTEVATVRLGEDVAASSSPRPYLHPVRTLAGTPVSDEAPEDHPWHLGVGVAAPEVTPVDADATPTATGSNLWGGVTYRAGEGYGWHDDHGSIVRTSARSERVGRDGGSRLTEELDWRGSGQGLLLQEHRTWSATWLPGPHRGWRLGLLDVLRAGAGAVRLDSPGSRGLSGSGYGGFFWRLPPLQEVRVRCERGEGLVAAHGAVSGWLVLTAVVPATESGPDRPVTLVLASPDADPWFVRVPERPGAGTCGIGRALAWDAPLLLQAGQEARREVAVAVLDDHLDEVAATALGTVLLHGPDGGAPSGARPAGGSGGPRHDAEVRACR